MDEEAWIETEEATKQRVNFRAYYVFTPTYPIALQWLLRGYLDFGGQDR